ncbi:MAG: uroporphyrinogen decarboxylase [Chloroflexi bacterium]|nr:uroporphyrinogen decarboxylase [Chloroflexota bacterium]
MSEKWDRVQAVLTGETADRVPVTMWRHFYDQETTAEGLADSMLWFQREYDWDFMKVNPRAQYHVEDWGAGFHYAGDPYSGPTMVKAPIKSPQDWAKIQSLDPHKGVLGEHLRALRRIRQGLKGQVPFVMTVFNPVSIAGRMVEPETVLAQHLREHPEKVTPALEAITETFRAFVTECLNVGVDGIFFATTAWASHDLLTEQEYAQFGRPYDLQVLEAARGARFCILHVCRSNNMLRLLSNYPVHALNWDDRDPTNPTLKEARGFTSKAFIGGVDRQVLTRSGSPEAAAQQSRDALAQTGSLGIMVGPTCSISPRSPEASLRAVKGAVW